MARSNKLPITFRPVVLADADCIARWTADPRLPPSQGIWLAKHQLILFWAATGRPTFGTDWMALRGDEPLFYLEIEEEDVFLRAPTGALADLSTALEYWLSTIDHLHTLHTQPRMRVTLDTSRELECQLLLENQFEELPPTLNPNERRFERAL
ncbi:hypothetical protein [Puia sp.]|jgi:hypothetical protein|uniref:hypothetical protein n=1 Tax=Puia sp. TaxID=2045100 RepID=UPI002F3E7C58